MGSARDYLIISFAMVAIFSGLSFPIGSVAYPQRDIRCIKYLGEGTLYGGQPECVQPPLTYALGLAAPVDLDMFFWLVTAASHFFALFFTLLLADCGKRMFCVFLAGGYCFTVLPALRGHPETAIACAFVMAAAYAMIKVERPFLAGCLGALALASKVTSLSGLGAIAAASSFILMKKGLVFTDDSVRIMQDEVLGAARVLGAFFAPMAAYVGLANMIWPNYLAYTVLSHQVSVGYLESVIGIITSSPVKNPDLLIFYGILGSACVYFLKSWAWQAPAYMVACSLTFIHLFRPAGTITTLFENHYTVFHIPFLLLLCSRWLCAMDEKRALRGGAVVCAFLILIGPFSAYGEPSIKGHMARATSGHSRLEGEIDELRGLIDGFWKAIPENEGRVLVNQQIMDVLLRIDSGLDLSKVENRNNPPHKSKYIDVAFVPGLKEQGVLTQESFGFYDSERELAQKIKAGEYQYILVGPKAWDTKIEYAITYAGDIPDYCIIGLPFFSPHHNERHLGTARLDSNQKCAKALEAAYAHSLEVFDRVCEMDEWAANYLIVTMLSNNIVTLGDSDPKPFDIGLRCSSNADLTVRYNASKKSEHLKIPIFLASSMLLLLAVKM